MSIVKLSEIYIDKMTKDDIEGVVEIEEEAYGKHHWAKSSFYDEMSNNLAKYYTAKLLTENSLDMPEHGILLMRDILLQ